MAKQEELKSFQELITAEKQKAKPDSSLFRSVMVKPRENRIIPVNALSHPIHLYHVFSKQMFVDCF